RIRSRLRSGYNRCPKWARHRLYAALPKAHPEFVIGSHPILRGLAPVGADGKGSGFTTGGRRFRISFLARAGRLENEPRAVGGLKHRAIDSPILFGHRDDEKTPQAQAPWRAAAHVRPVASEGFRDLGLQAGLALSQCLERCDERSVFRVVV